MMKVTLNVNGQEKTFSEQELVEILETFFQNETGTNRENATEMLVKTPTEGEWFEVNIQTINQELFKDKRADRDQEKTRQLILEAFEEVKKDPEKYGRKFRTMMPKKTWNVLTVDGLKLLARTFDGNMADWVEQSLEWAQRIDNGESWENVCNEPDTANWYRLIIWKDGHTKKVGGSLNKLLLEESIRDLVEAIAGSVKQALKDAGLTNGSPASLTSHVFYTTLIELNDTVPLVVRR